MSEQQDTLRRFVTSAAILGATLVLVDGGRGLTGRAAGGPVGCGGEMAETTQGAAGLLPDERPRELTALVPVLERGHSQVRYTAPTGRSFSSSSVSPTSPPSVQPPSGELVPTRIPGPRPGPSLFVAVADLNARSFADALRNSSLAPIVANPYIRLTVFAPDDAAWDRLRVLRPDLFEPENAGLLEEVLGQHIVATELRAGGMKPGHHDSIIPGAGLRVDTPDGRDFVIRSHTGDEASVDPNSEIVAENGIAMGANKVVIPPMTFWAHLRNLGFEMFVGAVEATDQVERFVDLDRPLTLLVPTDAAFQLAGWTMNRLHDPGSRRQVEAIIDAHVIEAGYDSTLLGSDRRMASDGALLHAFFSPSRSLMIERVESGSTASLVLVDHPVANGWLHAVDLLFLD